MMEFVLKMMGEGPRDERWIELGCIFTFKMLIL